MFAIRSLLLTLLPGALAAKGYLHSSILNDATPLKRWTSDNPSVTVSGSVCTVKPLGGGRDDGPNLMYAFQLCGEKALIDLPGYYTLHTLLHTTLKSVEIRLSGGITYAPDLDFWSEASYKIAYQNSSTFWVFEGDGVTFHGGGTIDGQGQTWWNYIAADPGYTIYRPIMFTIANSSNVVVEDLSIINSPNWHNLVYGSDDITYTNLQISSVSYNDSAPAKNTDGWDVYRSTNIVISDSNIQNGDDCVSIKPNVTQALIENLVCNGSHGISVGSLGQYYGVADLVSDIMVRNISMSNAQNGARIKVWAGANGSVPDAGGGTGYVTNVTYQDFVNYNVDNPMVITSCYGTSTEACEKYPSAMNLSSIHFVDVTGTASAKAKRIVGTLECSSQCEVTATGTDLQPSQGGVPEFLCSNIANVGQLDFNCTDVAPGYVPA